MSDSSDDTKATNKPGYAQITNTALEAASGARLSQHQYQVLFAVLRKTCGWNKEWDYICGDQLAELTGLKRQDCSKALNQLIELNVINRKGGSRSPVRINPEISAWEKPQKESKNNRVNHKKKNGSLNQNMVHSVNHKKGHTKDNKYNTSISKDIECSELHSEHDESSNKNSGYPNCPHKEILSLWAEIIPETVQHNPQSWSSGRSGHKNLASRWKSGFVTQKRDGSGFLYHDKESGIEWWKRLFIHLRKSNFLINECRPFCLEWAVKPSNYNKIVEGNYHA